MEATRRQAIGAFLVSGGTALVGGRAAMAAEAKMVNTKGGNLRSAQHVPIKLPFDPKRLRGISEKLIVSHWENNYGGAVKNLNKLEEELQHLSKDSPGFLLGGLKERELLFTNSMILHELYFGNLGGDGKISGSVEAALADAYGSLGRWEEQFRALGGSLAGGSGWAIVDWNFQTGAIATYWSGNHTQALAFGAPLLVMDMYEHAYQMDYGAAAAKYIDAFMQNVRWDEVNRRFERASKLRSLYAG